MRRRRALAIVLGGAGALTGALALLVRRRRRRPGELIEAVVRETFPYLRLVPTDLERFAGQFLQGAPLAEARLRQSRTTGDRAEAGSSSTPSAKPFSIPRISSGTGPTSRAPCGSWP